MFESILDFGTGLFDTLTTPRQITPTVSPTISGTMSGTPTVNPTIDSVSSGTFDPFASGGSSAQSVGMYGPSLLESLVSTGGSIANIAGGIGSLNAANEAVDIMAERQRMSEDAYRRYLAEQEKRQSLNF